MTTDTQFVRGAQRLGRRIKTIREKYALPPLIDEIGGLLHRRVLERFDRQVTPTNQPWARLAPSTLRRKRQLGYGSKPSLVRTGEMRKSIQVIRGRADLGTFFNTGAGLRIGITDPDIAEFATVQNSGNRRIPARRFLGLGPLDIKSVDSFLRRKARQLESQI